MTALAMLLLRPYGVVLEGVTSSVNVVFALTACVLVVALGRGPIADTASTGTMWETTAVSAIPLLLSLLARRPVVQAARLVGILGCGSLRSPTVVPSSRSRQLEPPPAAIDQCICSQLDVSTPSARARMQWMDGGVAVSNLDKLFGERLRGPRQPPVTVVASMFVMGHPHVALTITTL